MEMNENRYTRETTADIIVSEFASEESSSTFARDYFKAEFFSSIVEGLFNARRQAGLTQKQVAEQLHTKQAAIARLEADSDGSLSFRRYLDFALACGMVPLNITLVPIEAAREFVISHPEAPFTEACFSDWMKQKAEPLSVFPPPSGRPLTIQAIIHTTQSISSEMLSQEQYQGWVEQDLLQVKGNGKTSSTFTSQKVTSIQTISSSDVIGRKVAA